MKEMSLQQAVEFWTYLHDQAELKKQVFVDAPSGSSYKDEMRAEAETYAGLAKKFANNFEQPITSAADITHGLTAEQSAGLLDYIDQRTIVLKAALEKTRSKRQEALTRVQGSEYYRVKSIYDEMENLEERQIRAFENSRKSFMSILEE